MPLTRSDSFPVAPRTLRLPQLAAALGAGQIAGVVMGVVVMAVFGLLLHERFLFPLQVMGGLLLGTGALMHPWSAAIGLIAHQLGPSLVWSLVFLVGVSLLHQRPSLSTSLALGLALGLVAEIADVYVLMPAFQREMNGFDLWRENVPRFWDWAAHAVYGLSLGYAYFRLERPLLEGEKLHDVVR